MSVRLGDAMMTVRFLVLVSLFCVGCADNAITEFRPRLPVGDAERGFALVEFLPQASGEDANSLFNTDWGTSQVDAFQLGNAPIEPDVSVVASPDNIGNNLLIRIRFCATSACDTTASEARYQVEEPFYEGQTTYLDIDVPLPAVNQGPELSVFTVCEVKGCRCGTPTMACARDYGKADQCRNLMGFEGRPHYCIMPN